MPLPSSLKPSADAMARTVGDEAVILDLASGRYFGLDPVGARFWQLIAQGRTLDQAEAVLLEEYEVQAPQLRQDLEALAAQLLAEGLLQAG